MRILFLKHYTDDMDACIKTTNGPAIFKMDNQQRPTLQHMELLIVMWHPGWEWGLEEYGYIYIYG